MFSANQEEVRRSRYGIEIDAPGTGFGFGPFPSRPELGGTGHHRVYKQGPEEYRGAVHHHGAGRARRRVGTRKLVYSASRKKNRNLHGPCGADFYPNMPIVQQPHCSMGHQNLAVRCHVEIHEGTGKFMGRCIVKILPTIDEGQTKEKQSQDPRRPEKRRMASTTDTSRRKYSDE